MPPPTVCILTAGRGTRMGPYASQSNKALLPIKQKAVLSHIIDLFPPESEFVIAVGHLAHQVRDYLELAHADRKFTLVPIENFDGPGSGPGHSLLCCAAHLQKPFYFVSCDTLWTRALDWIEDRNWMGVARVEEKESAVYCNFEIRDGVVTGVRDKARAAWPPYKAFVGLCFIKDFPIFWEGLKTPGLIAGELQVSNGINALIDHAAPLATDIDWIDVGNWEQYRAAVNRFENFDFSKSNEFLYIVNKRVIKFFADPEITAKRVAKSRLKPDVFPVVTEHRGQFYAYELAPGRTLYQENSPALFRQFLEWLKARLWTPAAITPDEMRRICRKFYYDKTMERLETLRRNLAVSDTAASINGTAVPPLAELLSQVPWDNLCDGIPSFFHGDLQFDNVLHDESSGRFVLLDWRQDFGGRVELGDLYYDLAKLYGGIVLNYDFIKQNLLFYSERDGAVSFDFAQRYLTPVYLEILEGFIHANNWELRRVRILVALIYLNMAPLHHDPFNRMLYALGRLRLARELAAA